MKSATDTGGGDTRAEFDKLADALLAKLDFSSPEANESDLLALSSIMTVTEKLMEEQEGLHEEMGADIEVGVLCMSCGADDIREQIEGVGIDGSVDYSADHARVLLYDVTSEDLERLIEANLDHVRRALGK